MVKASYDDSKVKETIDKKEASLIGEISDKVAGSVSDAIECELRDKIITFSDSVDDASEKVFTINNIFQNLTSTIESMEQDIDQTVKNIKTVLDDAKKDNEKLQKDLGESLHDWNELHKTFSASVEQVAAENEKNSANVSALGAKVQEFHFLQSTISESLESMQQDINQAVKKAKTVLDDTKKDNEKLQKDLGETLHDWNDLHKTFSSSVEQMATENERISTNISALSTQIQKFKFLQSEISDSLELLHQQFKNQNDTILEQKLTELQQAADKNTRVSLVTICTLVFSIIVVILEVVSFFI